MINGIIHSGQEIVTNGLVLHLDAAQLRSYPTTGTNLTDLSGSNFNGTLINGPTYSTLTGGSISFDGVNDYAQILNALMLGGQNYQVTVEIHFFLPNNAGGWLITNERESTNQGHGWYWCSNTQIFFSQHSNPQAPHEYRVYASATGISNLKINDWNILSYSVTTGTTSISCKFMINGYTETIENNSVIFGNIVTNEDNINIARFRNFTFGTVYSNIIVSNLKIYNRSLSITEQLQNYNAIKSRFIPSLITNGLVLNLDAGNSNSYPGSGNTWYDTSPNGNNMTLTNGPTYSSISGGVIVFDGIDDYTQSTMSVNSIVNVTIECWVNISSTSKKGAFVKVGGGPNGYSIGVGSNNMEFLGNEVIVLFSNIRWIDTNVTYGTGWKMVNLVLNASSVPSIYLNGSLLNSYSGANPITPTNGVYIGRNIGDDPSGVRAFSGDISIVRMYNRGLSATEISSNYNAQKSRFGL